MEMKYDLKMAPSAKFITQNSLINADRYQRIQKPWQLVILFARSLSLSLPYCFHIELHFLLFILFNEQVNIDLLAKQQK